MIFLMPLFKIATEELLATRVSLNAKRVPTTEKSTSPVRLLSNKFDKSAADFTCQDRRTGG